MRGWDHIAPHLIKNQILRCFVLNRQIFYILYLKRVCLCTCTISLWRKGMPRDCAIRVSWVVWNMPYLKFCLSGDALHLLHMSFSAHQVFFAKTRTDDSYATRKDHLAILQTVEDLRTVAERYNHGPFHSGTCQQKKICWQGDFIYYCFIIIYKFYIINF